MGFFDSFLDSALGFMLNWDPTIAILVISLAISVLIVVIYKLMTDQTEMKRLKDQLGEYQKKMKAEKGDPEKLMKLQKEAMSTNMQYMGKSMKPTFITFIPILLIFGWMNAHFAYEPLTPEQEFTLTAIMEKNIEGSASITVPEGLEVIGDSTKDITNGAAEFKLKGKEGEYFATITSNEQEIDKKIMITTAPKYASVIETYKSDVFKSAQLGNNQLKVIWKLSWIWVYIISAIVFSMVLRKVLKVY